MSRALVLSGGGAKGAWQLGAIESLAAKGLDFDVVAGVSTGALSAAFLAQGKGLAGFQSQVAALKALYLGLTGNDSIYKGRFLGLPGLLFHSSLYDPTPIRKKLDAGVTAAALKASGKLLRIGSCSLDSGQYRTITEADPRVIDFVMASASMPVFFPPVVINGEHWCDGGTRHVTPLSDAFAALFSLHPGLRNSAPDIATADEMYIVLCDPIPAFGYAKGSYGTGMPILERAIDLLTSQIYVDDLISACLANNAALAGQPMKLSSGRFAQYVKLYVLAPDPGTPLPDTLEFSPAKIRAALTSGAQAIVHDQAWLSTQLGLS